VNRPASSIGIVSKERGKKEEERGRRGSLLSVSSPIFFGGTLDIPHTNSYNLQLFIP
jgi:hypothetical protein